MSDEMKLYDDDTGVVLYAPDEDGEYRVEVTDGSSYEYLRPEEAVAFAKTILKHEGQGGDNVVLASSVSFNEALLRLAAAHERTVTFSYAKGDGSVIESRRLQPSTIKEVKGHVTFIGFDPDRDDVRAYRVDRMKGEVSVV